jgi:cobalt-zinc-cadmium efflux system outer membrane protein
MRTVVRRTVLLVTSCMLAGCATQRYQPAPIAPDTTASQFESRSLADAGLRSFEERNLGHAVSLSPSGAWDLQMLSLAALYFNPGLGLPRARLATAEGALVTAGARPNPTFDVTPGIPSPYLLGQDLLFLFETAGKRGLRVEAASRLDQAARLDVADSAWTVAMGVRVALLNDLVASRRLALLQSEEQTRADQVAIMGQMLAAGATTRFDVDVTRVERSRATGAVRAAEGQVADAKSALAAAIGVPTSAIDGVTFSWPELDTPPPAAALSLDRVRRDASLDRLDIRRALAQYAATEAALRAEVARQYPNVTLGPGYTYEERHSFFTVGLSISLPVFNRNQGPIAEAEGRREQAAAAFRQTQAQAIEKSERAFAAYNVALRTLAQAQSSYRLEQARLEVVHQRVAAGTDDQLSVDAEQLQLSALAQARLDALARAQQALGDLEDAVQRPRAPGEAFPVNAESPDLARLTPPTARP